VDLAPEDRSAFLAALHWLTTGQLKAVFLQDANSLAVKPDHLLEILNHLKKRFPQIERITSYARSPSLARLKLQQLVAFRKAGLNRIHVGLESGSNRVLEKVQKGATKEIHIQAGQLVKEAGLELSEYHMPGLGGRDLSEENARESADALNRIDPDFIRLRTLAIPPGVPLFKEFQEDRFRRCTDQEMVEEILLFLENLKGIRSKVRSDHVLNLLQEVSGTLPEDQNRMVGIIRRFLSLATEDRILFQVGRRLGIFTSLDDLANPDLRHLAQSNLRVLGITTQNADVVLNELIRRFV
jgi:hypothetical protein